MADIKRSYTRRKNLQAELEMVRAEWVEARDMANMAPGCRCGTCPPCTARVQEPTLAQRREKVRAELRKLDVEIGFHEAQRDPDRRILVGGFGDWEEVTLPDGRVALAPLKHD